MLQTRPIVFPATKLGLQQLMIMTRMLRGRKSMTFPDKGAIPYQGCLIRYQMLVRVAMNPRECIIGPRRLFNVHIAMPLSMAVVTMVCMWTAFFRTMPSMSSSAAAMSVILCDNYHVDYPEKHGKVIHTAPPRNIV